MTADTGVLAAGDRRKVIAQLLEDDGRVSVSDLSGRFGVTDVSIRRDLVILEDAGRLRRVHGGAVVTARNRHDSAFSAKARENSSAESS